MNEFVTAQMDSLRCDNAPDSREVDKLLTQLDFDLDADFLDWIRTCSEATGFISSDHFLQFWSIEDMISLNPYYDDIEECKDLFFFGSDGSNLGYAFEKSSGNVVAIDFLDIGDSKPKKIGLSFQDFLHSMNSGIND